MCLRGARLAPTDTQQGPLGAWRLAITFLTSQASLSLKPRPSVLSFPGPALPLASCSLPPCSQESLHGTLTLHLLPSQNLALPGGPLCCGPGLPDRTDAGQASAAPCPLRPTDVLIVQAAMHLPWFLEAPPRALLPSWGPMEYTATQFLGLLLSSGLSVHPSHQLSGPA